MHNRIIAFLLVVIISFGFIVYGIADTPTVSVGTVSAMPGDTVTIPVSISGNPGINTFSFGFLYDTSMFVLSDVQLSPEIEGQFVYKKKAVWLNSSDVDYNGEILYLTFLVSDEAEGGQYEITLTYSRGDISNYNEEDIDFTVSPGAIIVGSNQTKESSFITLLKRVIEIIKSFIQSILIKLSL